MYLQEAAIDATLRAVSAFPSGSELVLTFLQPSEPAADYAASASSLLAERVASVGEPFVSRFEPEALKAKLLASGFSAVEFLSSEEARSSYFSRRPPELPVPRKTGLAFALLGSR